MRYLIPAITLIVGVLIGMFLLSKFHKGIARKIGEFHAEGYWDRFGKELKRRAGAIKEKALSSTVLRWLVILLIVGIILLILVGVIFFNDVLMFWSVFWWLSSSFSDSGLANEWLVYIIATVVAIPVVVGAKYILSFSHRKRLIGYGIICLWFLAYCGLMYWAERDSIYITSGEPRKCYSVLFDGEIELVPCDWKVHPTGAEVKPLTREIVYSVLAKKKGRPVSRIASPGTNAMYFAHDGTPLYCYYERDDGTIELFNMPCGAHPQFGKEAATRPVNAGIVKKYIEQKRTKQQSDPYDDPEFDGASELEKLKSSLESINIHD